MSKNKPSPKDINMWTQKDFSILPQREWRNESIYDAIILAPTRKKHDSGYRWVNIIGLIDDVPVEIAATCDHVWFFENLHPDMSIDCLFKSGLFRLWSNGKKIKVGSSLSSTVVNII